VVRGAATGAAGASQPPSAAIPASSNPGLNTRESANLSSPQGKTLSARWTRRIM